MAIMGGFDGRFEVGAEIGRGAHGRVVKAWDSEAQEWVAIKELTAAEDNDDLPLFKHEFRLAREIRHRNLVRLHELFVSPSKAFFTMELLEGSSLEELLKDSRPVDVQSVFGQLADGMSVLHSHGVVHRDIKPTNVFCTNDGRVVLLDYGLAVSLRLDPNHRFDDSIGGTFTYMAPEVLFGRSPGPASDWYSFGAALAECLIERPLFPENADDFVQAKMRELPDEVWIEAALESPGLVELCRSLLHPDPSQRADYETVCATLGRKPGRTGRLDEQSVFVGREVELDALRKAFLASSTNLECVVFHGAAGIGKSSLVENFLGQLEPARDRVVLRSKCDPQEAIRFNALDWIDNLAALLDELDDDQRKLVLPDQSAELGLLFPALSRHCDTHHEPDVHSPNVTKREAAAQLGFLLSRLSRLRNLIVWFDDIQWADRDSLRLLGQVAHYLRGVRMLILVTSRQGPEEKPILRRLLQQLQAGVFELKPLDDESIRALVRQTDPTFADADLDWLLGHAAGVPFFAKETLRLGGDLTSARREVPLRARMADWIAGLPDDLKDVLNLVVMSAVTPTLSDLQALFHGDSAARFAVFELCHRHLLKTTATAEEAVVEVYHDLWREIILELIEEERQIEYHRRFIEFFEDQASENALALHHHYLACDDTERASSYALEAGGAAIRDLAFSQAVDLYRMALELGVEPQDEWKVLERLANALAYDGRTVDATESYEAAAALAPGGDGSFESIRLSYQAASQCLWGGDQARGIALLADIAPKIGINVPATPRRAMWRSTVQRLRHWGAPLSAAQNDLAPDELTKLQLGVLEDVTLNMSIIDHKKAEALSIDFLRLAAERGRPSDVIHALCIEAANEANIGGGGLMGRQLRRRSLQLLDKAELISEQTTHHDRAHVRCMRCCVNLFLGNYRESIESGQEGLAFFADRSSAQSWRIGPTVNYLSMAYYAAGDIPLLRALAAAHSRDDSPMSRLALGFGGAFLLQVDGATEGVGEIVDAMEAKLGSQRFSSGHWGVWMTKSNLLLYERRYGEVWRYIAATWPLLRKELFLKLDWIAVSVRFHRGRAALHMLRRNEAVAEARKALREDVSALGRSAMPNALAYAATLRAGMARLEGDTEAAALELKTARSAFAACGMQLMRQLVQWRSEQLSGGEPSIPAVPVDADGTRLADAIFLNLADAYVP